MRRPSRRLSAAILRLACEYKKGQADESTMQRIKLIMEEVGLKEEDRVVVAPAREYARKNMKKLSNNDISSATALAMDDGTIITGKSSDIMVSCAAATLNAIKYLAGIADEIPLISPNVLETIVNLKKNDLHSKYCALNLEEILIALSISAVTNPTAQMALDKLEKLNGVQGHSTIMLTHNDEQTLRKLGVDMTCDAEYPSENLAYS